MKKVILAISLSFCSLIAFNVKAQDDTEEQASFEVLDIFGSLMTRDYNKIEGVLVEVYQNNKLVDSFTTKKTGKFKFTLMSGAIYTLQFSKKGYYTKRVSVNTKLPEGIDDSYKFDFDIDLMQKEEGTIDKYLMEYPAVLIAFNKKKDKFDFDKDYTKTYFEELKLSN